ncbi:MAG: alpha-L-fucosidase [Puniceicoccales bacterium]|jgi:alpha-L-fucosidase|nr:alpha-L-fucosidase [Puniceicoccales bacterium]
MHNTSIASPHLSRRAFLRGSLALAATTIVTPRQLFAASKRPKASTLQPPIFDQFQTPQWFKDVKFGLWLHWGPQSVPTEGGGWYGRHMYMQKCDRTWGARAWGYHREAFGHQSEFGFKDICNLWKAEKYNAEATMQQFVKWGARYVATVANHHDNFDLFPTSVHGWNSTKVGPMRDVLGEFAAAARNHNLKWMASVHAARAQFWFDTCMGADLDGPKKGVPYDGHLTKADGKGKWWDGLDPRQLYACAYPAFDAEVRQRHLELVGKYKPDILYFDDGPIIAETMMDACIKLYEDSLKDHGSIQAIVTIKGKKRGTILDREMGVARDLPEEYWQTDTSFNQDWFLRKGDNPVLNHNVRSLKETLVDIVSKRGNLMFNIAVEPDGSIPADQFAIMEEFGPWLLANGEAIYETEPWKIYGEGGIVGGGHFSERRAKNKGWGTEVRRYTTAKDKKTLYAHIFGELAGQTLTLPSLADKKLFSGKVNTVSLIGKGQAPVKWALVPEGLRVTFADSVAFKDCNALKIETTGL